MLYKKIIAFYSVLCLIGVSTVSLITIESKALLESPTVKINIDPNTIIYEGDIINCTITGNPTFVYWSINNQSKHTTFYGDDPVIFDPEPTPLDTEYVTLTVYAENACGNASDSVRVIVKRIYFGDIHWHSTICDGDYLLDTMYKNAIKDNYLDFVCYSGHSEYINEWDFCRIRVVIRNIIQCLMFWRDEWKIIKEKVNKYYDEGKFTTLLGFEWGAGPEMPGGSKQSENGSEDVSHVNFYYKDVYPDALEYSPYKILTYDDIFKVMSEEWDKGNLNIGFPHHPQGKSFWKGAELEYTTNWTFLANYMKNTEARDKILRGVEVYSRWGNAIGQYSDLPISWPYPPNNLYNQTDAWVENAMWEWSENLKGRKFVMQAGSDTHGVNRPGSAKEDILGNGNPSGIIAAYTIHNTRDEIWDAMNDCSIYGTQLLKIRANVRVDGQMALGQWINCTCNDTNPLKIRISAMSTFPGLDHGDKNMRPYKYSCGELDHPIQDIWLLKKDRDRGRPYCKIIGHAEPNEDMAVVTFEDYDVQPNDFYYVAIRQKGQELRPGQNEYMAFIGPVFIKNVV
ncbi:MAG: DUF3604 domain-containing protein [Euryarchaeota archaeon]|nr:DUF3604 domain-containing protein [Euryarchaeota archaeon]